MRYLDVCDYLLRAVRDGWLDFGFPLFPLSSFPLFPQPLSLSPFPIPPNPPFQPNHPPKKPPKILSSNRNPTLDSAAQYGTVPDVDILALFYGLCTGAVGCLGCWGSEKEIGGGGGCYKSRGDRKAGDEGGEC